MNGYNLQIQPSTKIKILPLGYPKTGKSTVGYIFVSMSFLWPGWKQKPKKELYKTRCHVASYKASTITIQLIILYILINFL